MASAHPGPRRLRRRATLRTAHERSGNSRDSEKPETAPAASAIGEAHGVHVQFTLPVDSQSMLSVLHRVAKQADTQAVREPDVMSIKEITRRFGCHRSTIYRWQKQGYFPPRHAPNGHPIGWLRADVEKLLRSTPSVERPADDLSR